MISHSNDKNSGSSDNEGPVTVIVTRKAKKGMTREFEEWMDGIIHEAMKFEGHMGVNVILPSDPASNPEYVIIFRFNQYENLRKWESSDIRKQWLEKSKEVTDGEPHTIIQTGLEFWFKPRSNAQDNGGKNSTQAIMPPRYKMAIVTTCIVFVLLNTLIPQIRLMTSSLPIHLSTLIGVIIMVLLMTYVVMPLAAKLLKRWLYKEKSSF